MQWRAIWRSLWAMRRRDGLAYVEQVLMESEASK